MAGVRGRSRKRVCFKQPLSPSASSDPIASSERRAGGWEGNLVAIFKAYPCTRPNYFSLAICRDRSPLRYAATFFWCCASVVANREWPGFAGSLTKYR